MKKKPMGDPSPRAATLFAPSNTPAIANLSDEIAGL
jgi:hypothetical protein